MDPASARLAYQPVAKNGDFAGRAAAFRKRRLSNKRNNWLLGMTLDLVFAVAPWVLTASCMAVALVTLYESSEGTKDTFSVFNAPVAVAAVSTFSAFLLVSKQSTNFANNKTIIGEFGNLSGSAVNIALFLKSQISSGKTVEFITVPDGMGGYFQTTRIGLVPERVLLRQVLRLQCPDQPEGLPIGRTSACSSRRRADAAGKRRPWDGALPGADPHDRRARRRVQPGGEAGEYAVLFAQVNAVTAAEGAISGTVAFAGSYLAVLAHHAVHHLPVPDPATELVPKTAGTPCG